MLSPCVSWQVTEDVIWRQEQGINPVDPEWRAYEAEKNLGTDHDEGEGKASVTTMAPLVSHWFIEGSHQRRKW